MKPFLPLRCLAVGAFILLTATGSSALTLGRSQGLAIIGRPLDLSVQLGLDAGAEPAALCLEAEVSYGETRLDAGRVSTRLESVVGINGTVRIGSSVPVNEPVVTVYLRVGCSQKISRRYVLLAEPADLSAEPVASQRQAEVPAAGAAAGVPSAQRLTTAPPVFQASPALAAFTARPEARRRGAAANGERATAAAAVGKMAKGSAPPQLARLKLEPLELGIERNPELRLSTSLADITESAPQRRAEAAALWQALNTRPEDVIRNIQRLQGLESDAKELRDAIQKSNSDLTDLRGQLEKAQRQRYASMLIYALLALTVAAAAAAYAWRRSRSPTGSGRDWWRAREAVSDTGFGAEPLSRPRSQTQATSRTGSEAAVLDLSFTESVLDKLQAKAAGAHPGSRVHAAGRGDASDFQGSQPASLRAVKAEELHDVEQQAHFFVSLGEHRQAIEVLRGHINVHPDTSALPWLDLLEILHKLQRREDYEAVREEFHRVFNAQAPAFDAYSEQSNGLEAYQKALSRIVALWPSPKVLEIIEETIFRKPGENGGEAFGLEAYRELLLLHNIGKDVIEGGDSQADFEPASDAQASGFFETSIQPLSALMSGGASSRFSDATALDFPPIGLDIDLDEPAPPSPEFMGRGASDPLPSVRADLIDFHLPDSGSQELKPKKPR